MTYPALRLAFSKARSIVRHAPAPAAGSWLALAACTLACAREGVDLGGGTLTRDIQSAGRCTESVLLEENVLVSNQEELDALVGCEEIRGNLIVRVFAGADLTPLAALRVVEGQFALGVEQDWDAIFGFLVSDRLDAEIELIRAGWVESLAGVQALQRVGALYARGLPDADLTAFESLESVGGSLAGGLRGQVILQQNLQLRDLAGLENLDDMLGLVVTLSSELVSLNGLDPRELESLQLYSSPKLEDIDALSSVTDLDGVTLFETGVRDLDAFAALRTAPSGVTLFANPALVDASGLSGLQTADVISVLDNAALKTLPSFVNFIVQPRTIAIRDNPELESVVLDFANAPTQLYNLDGFFGLVGDDAGVELGMDVLDIRNNAKLQSITVPAGLTKAHLLLAGENPSLTRIDFGTLRELGQLSIARNESLTEVDTGALSQVNFLQVIENSQLSPAVFDDIPSFAREIRDNAE